MSRMMLEVEAEDQGIVEAFWELLDKLKQRRREAHNSELID